MRLTRILFIFWFLSALLGACEEPAEEGANSDGLADVAQSRLKVSLRTWALDMHVPGYEDQPISPSFNISYQSNTSVYIWLRATPNTGGTSGDYSCAYTSPDPLGRDLYVGIQKWNTDTSSWGSIPQNRLWTLCTLDPDLIGMPDGTSFLEKQIPVSLNPGKYRLVAHYPDGKTGILGEKMAYIGFYY